MRVDRRRLMSGAMAGAAAALVAPTVASAAGNPDAELIRLCATFDTNEKRYLSLFPGGGDAIDNDDERELLTDQIQEEQSVLSEQITAHRIRTLAGFVAVATSLGLWDQEIGGPDDHDTINQKFVAMLVRDARRVA